MAEIRTIVESLKITYEGLFRIKELYFLIDDFFREKGYDKYEKVNREQVFADGKDIFIAWEFDKYHTDYIILKIKMKMFVRNLKDVETEIDGRKVRVNQGKVTVTFSGHLVTDWEGRWEGKPVYFFFRTIFDKFIYRTETKQFEIEIVDNCNALKNTVESYLNLEKFRQQV